MSYTALIHSATADWVVTECQVSSGPWGYSMSNTDQVLVFTECVCWGIKQANTQYF